LTGVEKVMFGAAADGVVAATRQDLVDSRPAADQIRASQRVNRVVPGETSNRV
jgi:hypothetical protein